jgi:hypothetical protein
MGKIGMNLRHRFSLSAAIACLALAPGMSLAQPALGGWLPRILPWDNPWNTDISWAPADWSSNDFIWFLNRWGTLKLHPDMGGDVPGTWDRCYGFPYITVDWWQPKVAVDFDYPTISDGFDTSTWQSYPFYPIPDEAIWNARWIQGGPPGYVWERNQDRHMLIVDRDNNYLYELYNVWFDQSRWRWVAGSGVLWNMNINQQRPNGWPSADESGLAMLPGMLRWDEVYGPDEINHALRVSVPDVNSYVFPATNTTDWVPGALPFGARLRLRADVDISYFPWEMQKVFRAMKKYGLIVSTRCYCDLMISGTYDTRWDNGILNPAFHSLSAWDFEVVQLGWRP